MPDSAPPQAPARPPETAGASAFPHWLHGWHDDTTDLAARLRRLLDQGSYAHALAGQILDRLETLDAALKPTAADRCRANLAYGADEDEAVELALEDVEEDARRWRVRTADGARPVEASHAEAA